MNSAPWLESALALTLLHSLWQVALLALLGAGLLTALDRRGAAPKHAAGMMILLGMAAAPLATFLSMIGKPIAPTIVAAADEASPGMTVLVRDSSRTMSVGLLHFLPWAWALGVCFMAIRLMGGWWIVHRLSVKGFQPLAPLWSQRVEALRRTLGIWRAVAIHVGRNVDVPCAARALRPVIWLPLSIFTQLPPEQVEVLIAHELAHIRRLDWIWNGMQCGVEALLFYHPGVWWLSRRVRQEREHACDDLAVEACGDSIVLAEALATVERLRVSRHKLVLAANGGILMKRVLRLLSVREPSRLRWVAPAGLVVMLCAGALLASRIDAPETPRVDLKAPHVASGTWWSQAGNSFEAHGRVDGEDRVYKQWVDPSGQIQERFTKNGNPAALDAAALQWIAQEMARPIPKPAPIPPMPAIPVLPDPPSIVDSAPFQAALTFVQADARPTELLGIPVSAAVGGPSRIDDTRAELSIRLSGPKGSAALHAVGRRDGASWRFSQLELQQPGGDAPVNLALR